MDKKYHLECYGQRFYITASSLEAAKTKAAEKVSKILGVRVPPEAFISRLK